MSDHRVPLGRGGWSLWRWVWLRGAGFAGADVLALGSDAIGDAFARESELEQLVERCRETAVEARAAALADGLDRAKIPKVRAHLRAGAAPIPPSGVAAVDAAIEQLREAAGELARCREAFDDVVGTERSRVDRRIRELAGDPRFREALIWQNRAILGTGVDRLLDSPLEADDFKTRDRQRIIAKYVQRYSVKNDSIGFFGPTGWGSLDAAAPGFVAMPGRALVDRRVVSFENWAIEALAAQLSHDPAMRPIFKPRRRASTWLEDDMLHMPPAPPRHATHREVVLLTAATGATTARKIAEAAVADPRSGLASIGDAYAELERLARENLITWGIELPAELEHPERWLRETLAGIEDPEVRARALQPLDRLEAARDRVSAAAGDPAALEIAVAQLEQEFHDITKLSEKRGHGKTYAGRQIFFEDCRRAIDLRIGRAFLEALDPPLSLILYSARWFTYEIARRYRRAFRQTYQRLLGGSGRQVPLVTFLAASRGLFSDSQHEKAPIVDEVQGELQRRWAEVLGIDRAEPGTRAVELASRDCRTRVRELFQAPCPGWPRARFQCPDLMIAAASVADIEHGNYLAILGEVHPGVNTLLTHLAFHMHPERAAVCEAYDADMEMVCIAPLHSGLNRVMHSPLSPRHHHVEFGAVRSWRPRSHVHLAGDLYVEEVDDRLRVRSRRADIDHDIIGFMDHYLGAEAMSHFKILAQRAHRPRVAIDKLVIAREQWHLTPGEFSELTRPAEEAERIRRISAWARRLGLPRFAFGTVPDEPKPFYVDFGSPIYIDVFVRYLTGATALGLSEMLPAHDELWLRDGHGRSYTSELRLAAVDPECWSPIHDLEIARSE
ncbi:MAG TPA: lantibiotic dehydratase [Kofleriaceae bacterium]